MLLKRLFLIPLLALALGAGGCAVVQKVGDFASAVTAPFTNPVSAINVYQVKLAYAAGQELVLEYKDKCFGADGRKSVAVIRADPVLNVICHKRVSRWRAMQAAEAKAYAAIRSAETFIANNPTGNAVSYITAAWAAVNDFKARASN